MPDDRVVELQVGPKSPLVLNHEEEAALKELVKAMPLWMPVQYRPQHDVLKKCIEHAEGPFRNE